jgi:choline dehydrogenase-like flavoprotein
MSNQEYDVVIAGSGIAGSILAKTLTKAGKKVLLLEAGLASGINLDGPSAQTTYQGYLDTFYNAVAKVPNSPYPNIKDAPSIDVLDIQVLSPGKPSTTGYLVQEGPSPFASDCVRGPGGTTLHWMGTTLRMLPNDFQMKTKYNQGVDWPFPYKALVPYYEMAENEIGVSGNVEEQILPGAGDGYFGKGYIYPMKKIPQSYLDNNVKDKTENSKVSMKGTQYTLTCISTPQGRNSMPNAEYNLADLTWDSAAGKLTWQKGVGGYKPVGSVWDPYTGQRCEGNSSCTPICPVQAKYNALKTLKKADPALLDIIPQAVASTLLIEKGSGLITGIQYKKYQQGDIPTYTTAIAKGAIYVLAANAIENAKILLASDAAKSSDQVGRNLMDHLVMLTWGVYPEKLFPYRGPGSTTNIPTFRDGDFRKDHTAWIQPLDNWGWSWPVFSPGSDLSTAVINAMMGTQLRTYLEDTVARQFLMHFECEQAPDPDNRVVIDAKYKDLLDNFRPVIQYHITPYEGKAFESAKEVSDQIFAAIGVQDRTSYNKGNDPGYVEYNGKGYTYRGAGHLVGTHRMGTDKTNSVVDPDMRCWDHPNLFLAGCGNMPTLGTSNPTLTMAALTFKAAEAILKQLEK